jgi:hypothetical protein
MNLKSLLCVGIVLLLAGLLPAKSPTMAMPADPPATTTQAPRTQGAEAQAWASDWEVITPGQTLTLAHNLGGDVEDYRVQLWFLDLPLGGRGIHIYGYGGIEAGGVDYLNDGAYWTNLTPTSIDVVRLLSDTTADRVRVWIWKPSPAEEGCSGWEEIAQSDFFTFFHHLGGNADDYSVSLWFKDATGHIHHLGYGGLEVAGERRGAYWRSLDNQWVSAYRYTHDPYVDQVRLCVSVAEEPPIYDSGWRDIDAGETLTLTHDVGGNVNGYIVDLEFKDTEGQLGIHNAGLGGDFLDPVSFGESAATAEHGGYWQRLTSSTIQVVRQQYDPYINQVRVRIWQRKVRVFLPLVVRGY